MCVGAWPAGVTQNATLLKTSSVTAKGQNEHTFAMCIAVAFARECACCIPVAASVIWLALLPFA